MNDLVATRIEIPLPARVGIRWFQERRYCILIVDQLRGPNGLRFSCNSLRFNCNRHYLASFGTRSFSKLRNQPPDVDSFMVLFKKHGLPSAYSEGYIPVVTPVEETLARRFLHLSFEGCSRRGIKRQFIAQVTNPYVFVNAS